MTNLKALFVNLSDPGFICWFHLRKVRFVFDNKVTSTVAKLSGLLDLLE